MAKAAVPYEQLQIELERLYPEPIFQNMRLLKPKRGNNIRAPTAIYDRTAGSFKKIGYRCIIQGTMVTGIDSNWLYIRKKDFQRTILIEL